MLLALNVELQLRCLILKKKQHKYNNEYRILLIEALGRKCYICNSKRELQIHHIKHTCKPVLKNVALVCKKCHDKKHICVCSVCGVKHKKKVRGFKLKKQ